MKQQLATGALWMIGARLSVRLIGVLSTVVLARLLVPDDFGLIALAGSVVAVVEILGAFSFDQVLIANQDAERADYDAAWSMSVLKGVIGALLLAALAAPVATYFEEPRLQTVLLVLSGCLLLHGCENIGVVDFRKRLRFRSEFLFLLYSKLGGFIVTLTAAVALRDYRALLWGMFAQAACQTALSYVMSAYRPRWSLDRWRHIMQFSKWLLLNNALSVLSMRSAQFMLGKLAGVRATGLYSVASEIGTMLTTELVWPIQRAIFPGYAQLAADEAKIREAYLQVLGVVVAIGVPAGIGIALCADAIVMIFLGPKWIEAAPLIGVLSVAGACSLGTANAGSAFLALKKPRLITTLSAVLVVVRVPALYVGITQAHALGAAYAILATSIFHVALTLVMAMNVMRIPLRPMIEQLWRPLAAVCLMAVVVDGFVRHWGPVTGSTDALLMALPAVAIGAMVYAVGIVTLWYGAGRPEGTESAVIRFVSTMREGAIPGGRTP